MHVRVLTIGHGTRSADELVACLTDAGARTLVAVRRFPSSRRNLDAALAEPAPCFMCAETPWWRCHRRLLAELLAARGHEVLHLHGRGRSDATGPGTSPSIVK